MQTVCPLRLVALPMVKMLLSSLRVAPHEAALKGDQHGASQCHKRGPYDHDFWRWNLIFATEEQCYYGHSYSKDGLIVVQPKSLLTLSGLTFSW